MNAVPLFLAIDEASISASRLVSSRHAIRETAAAGATRRACLCARFNFLRPRSFARSQSQLDEREKRSCATAPLRFLRSMGERGTLAGCMAREVGGGALSDIAIGRTMELYFSQGAGLVNDEYTTWEENPFDLKRNRSRTLLPTKQINEAASPRKRLSSRLSRMRTHTLEQCRQSNRTIRSVPAACRQPRSRFARWAD